MLSNKITSSEFIENMCYFHFQMQVCTHVVMCGSNENYFGQCFLIKFPNVAAFTLYVYVQYIITPLYDGQVSCVPFHKQE